MEPLPDLSAASRDELLALIAGLQATLASERDRFVAQVATFETELTRLRERLSTPAKTPENSSVPPAKGFKADRAARRRAVKAEGQQPAKRGPKPGHRGISRSRVSSAAVDVIVPCRPETCAYCSHSLPAAGAR